MQHNQANASPAAQSLRRKPSGRGTMSGDDTVCGVSRRTQAVSNVCRVRSEQANQRLASLTRLPASSHMDPCY